MFETLLGGRSTISRLVFIQSLDTGSQRLIRSAAFSPTRRVSIPVAYTSAILTLIVGDY
jgi:hypothetical protein